MKKRSIFKHEKEGCMKQIQILILGVEKRSVVRKRLCKRGFSPKEKNAMLKLTVSTFPK